MSFLLDYSLRAIPHPSQPSIKSTQRTVRKRSRRSREALLAPSEQFLLDSSRLVSSRKRELAAAQKNFKQAFATLVRIDPQVASSEVALCTVQCVQRERELFKRGSR